MPETLAQCLGLVTMVRHSRLFWLWAGVLLGACALGLALWNSQRAHDSRPPPIGVVRPTTLEQLRDLLKEGMTTQELVRVIGQPMCRYQYEGGLEIWTYALSRKHMQKPWDEDIYGFDARITNGVLVNWGFIYIIGNASSDR